MNLRVKKIVLFLVAAVLLAGSGRLENSLNRDRAQLGLTISAPLQNAPPMLAFTTVALGGFRGLISNFLWIRANDLQLDDKYFEAAQLANWITDLEPHFAQVWSYQAWNMAFNISVKFKDFSDRWRWLQNGIELLRDRALLYNPDDPLIYQQLAWLFQFKMGQTLDDANVYYKTQWAEAMTPLFGPTGTNFDALVNPQTAREKTNAFLLREKYKIDPVFAQKVDRQWGPLDWRLPEAHAIYWASVGLRKAKEDPAKVKEDDLLQLRRVIFQSMLQAFHHGRLITNPFAQGYALAPNLDLVSQVDNAYETMMKEDEKDREHIATAHRNDLRDAVYFLYENDRIAEAAKWFKILGEKYPNKIILDGDANSFPRNLTLDEYAVRRVQLEVGDTSQERTTAVIQGLLANSYLSLAIGQDDRFAGFKLLAHKVYDSYETRINKAGNNEQRIGLPSFNLLDRTVLNDLLDPQKNMLPFAARAVIRSQLAMPGETNAASATTIFTNAPATIMPSPTNTPPANSVGK